MKVVKAGSHQIVKRDTALLDQVVHQVTGPTQDTGDLCGRAQCGGVDRGGGHSGEDHAQPGVEEVITSTRDGDRPLLTKARLTGRFAQNHWHLRKPCRFANFANEVGDGFRAAVCVFFLLVISGEIDKTGC